MTIALRELLANEISDFRRPEPGLPGRHSIFTSSRTSKASTWLATRLKLQPVQSQTQSSYLNNFFFYSSPSYPALSNYSNSSQFLLGTFVDLLRRSFESRLSSPRDAFHPLIPLPLYLLFCFSIHTQNAHHVEEFALQS